MVERNIKYRCSKRWMVCVSGLSFRRPFTRKPCESAAHCCLMWWCSLPNYLLILTCDLCSYPSVSAKHHDSLVRLREAVGFDTQLLTERASTPPPTSSLLQAESLTVTANNESLTMSSCH